MRAYEYRHVVALEETNLVGNVYYANPVRWQGRCRELFLRDHAPEVLDALSSGLALVTLRVSCEYVAELQAFDEIVVRMHLAAVTRNKIDMRFEYWRVGAEGEELVARGEQSVATMERRGEKTVPVPIPEGLMEALRAFGA